MHITGWLNSLGAKVLLAYLMGLALSMTLVLGGIAAVSIWQGPMAGLDVAGTAVDMSEDLRFGPDGVPIGFGMDGEFEYEWIFDSLKGEAAWRVLDSDGRTVMVSTAGDEFWPRSGPARRLASIRYDFEKDGVAIRAATASVVHGGRTWYLQFAASGRFLEVVYQAFALPFTSSGILLFSLTLFVTFGACGYATLRYTLRPLHEISRSAASIAPHSLSARLGVEGVPTEIAPLVASFNRVLERLEGGYRLQREFLGTAAHELKTPLALIRAQIELHAEGTDRDTLLNDLAHMSRQVQQLLLLAEASEMQSYRLAELDVRAVAQEAIDFLERMAESAGVTLRMEPAPAGDDGVASRWPADRGALFTLFKNLLENAIQHAPAGSEVRVAVTSTDATVRDFGPGVPPEQLSLMFDRFWRGAHRRDHGAGLGLAICQEIARAHDWRLSAHRAEPGLSFRIARAEA